MKPSRSLWEAMIDLLAADAGTLAPPANAMHVHLAIANFIPGLDLDIGTLTEATFTGSAAKSVTLGAQTVLVDPVTGKRKIQLGEPVGGWTWICTVAPAVAETVYGVYVTDNADAVLIGSFLLDTPVVIQAVDESVVVGKIDLAFDESSPS